MFVIIKHIVLTLAVAFFFGAGVTLLLVPERLKQYALWLSPWVFFLLTTSVLIFSNLLGLSVCNVTPFISIGFLGLNIYAFFKQKKRFNFSPIQDVLLVCFVLGSIIFYLSPIIRRDQMLTTVSLGNNDVSSYASTSDYLVNNCIFKNFYSTAVYMAADGGVSNLLSAGYRWGSILESYFLHIFWLEGFQYTYMFQAILYSLMIPLVYVFARILSKPSISLLLLVCSLVAFNANMTYLLYHNFFGQVFFWGVFLFILIHFFAYFDDEEVKKSSYTRYDFILGLSIAMLYWVYHEASIMVLSPIILFLLLRLPHRKEFLYYCRALFKIGLTAFILASASIIHAVVHAFAQAFLGDPNQPIGWELFRSKIPFANPFEAMGLYSIYNFAPLPTILAVVLSVGVMAVIVVGFLNVRQKMLYGTYIFVALFFNVWKGVLQHHFWDYGRTLTYTLPLFLILFAVGIVKIGQKNKLINALLIGALMILVIFSGAKLNKRFITERLAVDKTYVSLRATRNVSNGEAIFAEGLLDETVPLWKQIWTAYFLYPETREHNYLASASGARFWNSALDGKLVVISKSDPWIKGPAVLLSQILWENEGFKLGRLCSSDECLSSSTTDLSSLKIGESLYEDSLLKSGWSLREADGRWTSAQKASLRLVTKENDFFTSVIIEAMTLAVPQKLSVVIDDMPIGSIMLKKDWDTYELLVPYLSADVHDVVFNFSHSYSPAGLGISSDSRILPARFKFIGFK